MTNEANPRLADYLDHILEALARVRRYTRDMERANFEADDLVQDAVIRNREVIEEAARNIEKRHPDFITAHDDLPWAQACEMRNALSHGYFQIDLGIVWQTVVADLPTLEHQVRTLRDGMPGS